MNRFIEHSQVVTTSNYNTLADFHFMNHSTPIFSVYLHKSSLSVSWQQIYNTLTVKKSSNHTLSLHRLTSDSSATSNFPWVSPTENWTELLFPYSLISSWHRPHTANTAPVLSHAGLLGFPRDHYLACPMTCWLLPSSRKQCYHCCVLERVYRAIA
jgi:hypothetical protein